MDDLPDPSAEPPGRPVSGAHADPRAGAADPGPGTPADPGPGAPPAGEAPPRPPEGDEGRREQGAEGPSEGDPAKETLLRSRRQKVVAGVCGGMGRHWDLDPVIFRVVLAVLAVTSGVGLILYGFAWLLLPLEDEEESEARRLLSGRVEGPGLIALLCALGGCGLFLSQVASRSVMSFTSMLVLAVAGSAYWSRQRRRVTTQGAGPVDPATAQAMADAPPEATAPPAPGTPSWWRSPAEASGPAYLWGPADLPLPEHTPHPKSPAGRRGRAGRTVPTAPRRRSAADRGVPISGLVFLLAVAAGWASASARRTGHPLGDALQLGLACALGVFGLGMVVSAWWGRTRGTTVFWTLVTAALLAASSLLPRDISTEVGTRTAAPASPAAVRARYALGAGRERLDLGGLRPAGRTVRTRVEVGAGRIEVTVPQDVVTRVRVRVGAGELSLPDERQAHVRLGRDRPREITLPARGLRTGQKPSGTVDLDLRLGVGQVEVEQGSPSGAPSGAGAPAPAPTVPPTPSARRSG